MERKSSIQLQVYSKHIDDQLNDQTQPEAQEYTSSLKIRQNGQMLTDNHDAFNRPSSKGPFRPLRNGTIAASIMALLASAVAPGTMSLPSRVDQLGPVAFSIVLILTILLSYYGMVVMKWIILQYKVQSYAEMVSRALGDKMRDFSTFMLIFYTWGRSTCMIVIFMKIACELLYDVFSFPLFLSRDEEIYNGFGTLMRVFVGILMIVFNFKYLMMTNIKEVLDTIGKWSFKGILFCMAIIWLTAVFGFSRDYEGQTIDYLSIFSIDYSQIEWVRTLDWEYLACLFQAAAGVYFTMLNPQFVFPMVSHLKDPTRARVEYIFKWAHMHELGIFMLMGWLGYLLLAQHQQLIPIPSLVFTALPTWPLVFGKALLLFAIFFRLPLLLFTTKEFIYEATDLERCQENYKKMNIYLAMSSLVVAIVFKNINFFFSLIGGTLGVGIAAVIPLLCALKLIKLRVQQRYILMFMGAMSLVIFVGGVLSVTYPL